MKNLTKKYTQVILILSTIFFHFNLLAQNEREENIYFLNDKLIGYHNLPYINGPLHKNYDITSNKDIHRYLGKNEFILANLTYNNQNYYNLLLKYDIYKDELVLIPDQENSAIKINLIKNNISYFEFNNKSFFNLSIELSSNKSSGYYEQLVSNSSFTIYIKHFKDRKEGIFENKKIVEYYYNKTYYLLIHDKYYKISSMKDFIIIFPEMKNLIKKFYEDNEKLEVNNKDVFYSNLLKKIIN